MNYKFKFDRSFFGFGRAFEIEFDFNSVVDEEVDDVVQVVSDLTSVVEEECDNSVSESLDFLKLSIEVGSVAFDDSSSSLEVESYLSTALDLCILLKYAVSPVSGTILFFI